MPKAVMFDCYNTLLRYQSEEDKKGIWKILLTSIGYVTEQKLTVTPKKLKVMYQKACEREEEECKKSRGEYAEVSLRRVWEKVLKEVGISPDMAKEKAEDILLLHRLYARKQCFLFKNVEEELLKLKKQGMKLLLLSNAQTCFIYNELPEEIRKIFDVVFISEAEGIKKPSEDVFQLAFEKLGVKPEDVVFVGDSAEDDMIPTGKLGCHCIMIGEQIKKDDKISHVIEFNPYKESGYEGLSDIIVSLNREK